MPLRSKVDWDAVHDAAPHGVIRLKQLLELGVHSRTVGRNCERTGPWSRILPGIIMFSNAPPRWEQKLAAAVLYAGPPAVITGLAGARLHNLRRGPEPHQVHVLVQPCHQPASHDFVLVERTTRLPDPLWRQGFPTAPLERSVLDGCRRLQDLNSIRSLIAESVQRGFTTAADLMKELDAGSCRGSARPREVLREIGEGVRSAAEAWARDIAARSGLPKMWLNLGVYTVNGTHLATPDGWFDDVALAWEIDSYEFHLSPDDYATTLKRHNRMTAAGVIVVHTVPSRLRTEPDNVIAELRGAYELALQRPRPPLVVKPV